MNILVTRPQDDARELCDALVARGHTVVSSPLLEIQFVDLAPAFDALNIDPAACALAVTSRNALRALSRADLVSRVSGLTVFAVGPATAREARALGFQNIVEGPGTGDGLVREIVQHFAGRKRARVLHCRGEVARIDVAQALRAEGFEADAVDCYRAVPATELTLDARTSIARGEFEAVILMSPRTAKIYCQCVKAHGLRQEVAGLKHICISEATAQAVNEVNVRDIFVAERPQTADLLEVVNRISPQSNY